MNSVKEANRNERISVPGKSRESSVAYIDMGECERLPGIQQLREENEQLRLTVAQLRLSNAALEKLADSDSLTPLPNRRRFLRELDRTIAQVRRYGESAALLFVDVDNLKSINDSHGHAAGDEVLVHIARILAKAVREADCVARLGGDEFGVVLGKSDAGGAQTKAERLAAQIAAEPFGYLATAIPITVSIGMAMIDPAVDSSTLIARADAAMYRAKAGR